MPSQLSTHPAGSRVARERHGEVQDFLDRFAKALTAGDGKTIAAMWELPAFVFGADMARAIEKREEIEQFFGGAKEQYNAKGITDTRPEIRDEEWIGDRMVM